MLTAIDEMHPTVSEALPKRTIRLPLPSGLRAVIFDVDGTLYNQKRLRRAMAVKLAIWLARHPFSGSRVVQIIKCFRDAQEHLRNTNDDFLEGYDSLESAQLATAAHNAGTDIATVNNIIQEWMIERALPLITVCARPGLSELFLRLRSLGMRIGVYSDYQAHHKLRALGIEDSCDVVVSSYDKQVARFKPHPAGFQVAADRLGVAPSEAVYIGDRIDVDMEGAQAAGMHSILLAKRGKGNGGGFVRIGDLRDLTR